MVPRLVSNVAVFNGGLHTSESPKIVVARCGVPPVREGHRCIRRHRVRDRRVPDVNARRVRHSLVWRPMRFVVRAVAIVVGIAQLACGGAESPRPVEPQGPVVATIVVMAPPSPLQPGTTFALTAEVRDQTGVQIAGKTLTWSSGNAGIATVSSTGVVTAEG